MKKFIFSVLPPEPAKKYFDLPILHFESFICLVNDFCSSVPVSVSMSQICNSYLYFAMHKIRFEVSGFKQVNKGEPRNRDLIFILTEQNLKTARE